MNEGTVTISLERFKELEAKEQEKVHNIAEFDKLNEQLEEAKDTIRGLNSRIQRLERDLTEIEAPLSASRLCDMIDRMDFPISNIYKILRDIRVGVFWEQPLSDIDTNNIKNALDEAVYNYKCAICNCIDHYINKTHLINY